MHSIKIITKEQQQSSIWSGGTTTQIAIYPLDSNYGDRDFLWRLSTAVVEIKESNFTKLQGYDRHLMVLEGELKLVHKEQHTVVLKQYEQDSFKGAWETVSFGQARDFNLMLKEGAEGKLHKYSLSEEQNLIIEQEAKSGKQCFIGCYCYQGELSFEADEEKAVLLAGELLLIDYKDYLKMIFKNVGTNECSLITAFIEV